MRHLLAAVMMSGLIGLAASCGDKKDDSTSASGSDSSTTGCVAPTADDFAAFAMSSPSNPNSCTTQMYAKYQDAGFAAVTDKIVELSLDSAATPLIGSSFQDKLKNASTDRQQQFTQHLKLFLEQVYSGGTVTYPSDAPAMSTAHSGLEITFGQYEKFLSQIVVPALQAAGVPDDEIGACFAPPVLDIETVKSVVTCK